MERLLLVLRTRIRGLKLPRFAIADCRRGATAVEYALIAALIALALATTLHNLQESLIALPMARIEAAIAAVLP